MKTGIKISKLREQRKLSQELLAELIGVSQVTVGNWEQGKSIKHKYLKKISTVFDIPVDFLLDDDKKIVKQENKDSASNNINGYEVSIKTPQYVLDGLFSRLDKLIEILEKK
ncbi:helix-turn-helix domain-containing protein [Flavobacterium sp. J27]|uniref:helix-turn-helix domain-containing protein n=1 Tax=Flavobacterium sp. J27 TaxID=2060419 RepID=UPI00103224F1|nr:helix-turn-helix transcriptional regulator [Flavobacterium sp. J27]